MLKSIEVKLNINFFDDVEYYKSIAKKIIYTGKTNKKIKTNEDKINYFKDVSLTKLTAQDEKVFNKIKVFIEEELKN